MRFIFFAITLLCLAPASARAQDVKLPVQSWPNPISCSVTGLLQSIDDLESKKYDDTDKAECAPERPPVFVGPESMPEDPARMMKAYADRPCDTTLSCVMDRLTLENFGNTGETMEGR